MLGILKDELRRAMMLAGLLRFLMHKRNLFVVLSVVHKLTASQLFKKSIFVLSTCLTLKCHYSRLNLSFFNEC